MSSATAPSAEAWLADSQAWIEPLLDEVLAPSASVPRRLNEAMRYAVLGGGKRLRPALVRFVGRWCGADDFDVESPAIAVELIHAYSLVHDDLPCMDDDDWRRGRPSCHVQFGEALAVLVGDALQAQAFQVLSAFGRTSGADERCKPALFALASAVGGAGMVGGQALDIQLGGAQAQLVAIEEMHRKKTGALIAASAELGAIAARADDARRERAREWGRRLGALFQATDDLLDVTADKAALGKTPGKDAAQHKPTLVAVLGVAGTRRYAEEQAQAAQVLASELGGPWSATALQLVAFLLDRRK